MKTIYKNGAVYTGKLPLVEAFAVEDGKFVFAGSSAEADALAAAGDKVVDLGGKFVCSGFNDSHMHLLNYGSSLLKAQLAAHTESLEDMLACLDTFQKEHPRKRRRMADGPRLESGLLHGRGPHAEPLRS